MGHIHGCNTMPHQLVFGKVVCGHFAQTPDWRATPAAVHRAVERLRAQGLLLDVSGGDSRRGGYYVVSQTDSQDFMGGPVAAALTTDSRGGFNTPL